MLFYFLINITLKIHRDIKIFNKLYYLQMFSLQSGFVLGIDFHKCPEPVGFWGQMDSSSVELQSASCPSLQPHIFRSSKTSLSQLNPLGVKCICNTTRIRRKKTKIYKSDHVYPIPMLLSKE